MSLSNSLIRRYTPPTCTLEIWGKRSALSFWAERPLVKELNFALHFDDPRIPEEEQVTIRGDREQLELLGERVTDYVQGLLQESSSHLPLMLEPAISGVAFLPAGTELPNSDRASAVPPSSEISSFQSSIIALPEQELKAGVAPRLKPNGLLTHELSFGSLTTDPPRSSIQLGISQLFDLANALDEYSAEVDNLPSLDHAHRRKKMMGWVNMAAATILVVGLGTLGTKYLYPLNQSSESTALKFNAPNQSPVQDVVPPVPPAPTGTPVPSPTQAPPLAAQKPLPPPPGVKSATPPNRPTSVPLVVPPKPNLPPPPVAPSAPERRMIAIPPQSDPPVTPSTIPILPAPHSTGNLNISPIPPTTVTPQPSIANLPNLSSPSSESAASEDAIAANSNSARSNLSPSPSSAAPSSNQLLDTIPQVAEVREYFQQIWKVPPDFKQTLEYRLVLNKDGSIQRVIPLGKSATVYLPYVAIPAPNAPFVSPLAVEGNPTIRVVLGYDGTVKTFLEG